MGFIQMKLPKRIKRHLANSKRLRETRLKHEKWLKSQGLDNIKIEQAPQNAMYLAEGGSGFGGGYYDVGSGNASMSLGMGGFR